MWDRSLSIYQLIIGHLYSALDVKEPWDTLVSWIFVSPMNQEAINSPQSSLSWRQSSSTSAAGSSEVSRMQAAERMWLKRGMTGCPSCVSHWFTRQITDYWRRNVGQGAGGLGDIPPPPGFLRQQENRCFSQNIWTEHALARPAEYAPEGAYLWGESVRGMGRLCERQCFGLGLRRHLGMEVWEVGGGEEPVHEATEELIARVQWTLKAWDLGAHVVLCLISCNHKLCDGSSLLNLWSMGNSPYVMELRGFQSESVYQASSSL